MNVEQLLRTAVDDAVREVPPGFADVAVRRAARARRRARVTAGGGAALVVAAAAVGIAVVGAGGPSTGADPAGSGEGTGLGTLGTGPTPEVAWYADGMLRFGDQTTPAGAAWEEEADRPNIQRVSGGYVLETWDAGDVDGQSTLTLVRDDGERIVLAAGDATPPVVSADGERIAWGLVDHSWVAEKDALARAHTSTVVLADAAGEQVAELPDAPSPGIRPYGFLPDGRLLLEASATTSWGLYSWTPGGEVTPLREDVGIVAASPTGELAVLTDADGPGLVADLATDAGGWRLPAGEFGELAFSPDGQYLAALDRPVGTEAPDALVIRDAHDGDELARVPFRSIQELRWESPTTVVIEAYDDTGAALVRCSVGGDCERATEVHPADPGPDAFDRPYVLG